MTRERQPETVRDVVEHGLCIGCGLCEALAPERWVMRMNAEGRLRPAPVADGENAEEDADILSACPGVVARAEPRGDRSGRIVKP